MPSTNMKVSRAAPTTHAGTNALTKECGNCGAQASLFVHQVRLRGAFRRLCTSCVLRLHPSSFCPACFSFYDGVPPPLSKRIFCSKCTSFTHSHCAADALPSSHLCPPCKDPSFSFFRMNGKIDKRLSLAFLCAAKIAAASMNKAVIMANEEADRSVREAALARKRAREALEHLAHVANKEKDRRREEGSAELFSNANLEKINNGVLKEEEIENDEDEIDIDLVRHLEESLINEEEIGA